MPTFKTVILPTQKRADGSYNVKIRVTHNRKSKYIKTPHYVSAKEVARKKKDGKEELKIKNQAILDLMEETVMGYRKRLLTLGPSVDSWDVERLVGWLTSSPETFKLDIIKYGREYGQRLMDEGRTGTGKQYILAINSICRFLGRDTLDISEITVSFLKAYERHLKEEPAYKGTRDGRSKPTKSKKTGRALSLYLGNLKTLYNAAKLEFNDEERGIVNIPYSPFSRYTIPQPQEPEHRTLTIEQVQAIINLPYRPHKSRGYSGYNLAKDLFILSFALMGINTADLYETIGLQGDVLTYRRKKTRTRRKDKAEMQVKIEPEIMPLVEKYRKDSGFVFKYHYSSAVNFNKMVNHSLKNVGKDIGVENLTYYHARHTMASICANKLGVDIARVDEMLNHSDSRLALSRVYIEKDFKPLWDANRKLIDLFDWGFYNPSRG